MTGQPEFDPFLGRDYSLCHLIRTDTGAQQITCLTGVWISFPALRLPDFMTTHFHLVQRLLVTDTVWYHANFLRTAAIFWSIVRLHLSSWFIHQISLANTSRNTYYRSTHYHSDVTREAHITTVTVRPFLSRTFPDRCIGSGGPIARPPRSQDLTPVTRFLLWGFV
jgi:hypothetical protein